MLYIYILGIVLSIWCGCIKVMESLDHATKRGANIIAEYLGGAVTCDAHHMTDPRADGLGVSSCISKSLVDAGVSPEEVQLQFFVIVIFRPTSDKNMYYSSPT